MGLRSESGDGWRNGHRDVSEDGGGLPRSRETKESEVWVNDTESTPVESDISGFPLETLGMTSVEPRLPSVHRVTDFRIQDVSRPKFRSV